jgi:hypothetical protein
MSFNKTCPLCQEPFSSLVNYMEHIKSNHSKELPETFVRDGKELSFSFKKIE